MDRNTAAVINEKRGVLTDARGIASDGRGLANNAQAAVSSVENAQGLGGVATGACQPSREGGGDSK